MDLFWLPLGAGGWSVRRNGRVLEAVTSRLAGRPAQALVHSALVVRRAGVRSVIEMGPVWNVPGTPAERGSVGTGAVGIRWLGRSRWFRYEVRCWPGGVLPDEAEALGARDRRRPTPRSSCAPSAPCRSRPGAATTCAPAASGTRTP
ncbi:hypothetical protein ACFQX8_07020 [Klenkia terrae]|uniref:hypothetical protein n=1 Tax=Klenkia terrae TaxID=1052259 RepID=UPI003615BC3B